MEPVTFTTTDGVEIHGDFYGADGEQAAVLLHMMPVTKESWRAFAPHLVGRRIAVLAFDQRGHGESVYQEGRDAPLRYTEFSDEEQQQKINDVASAVAWLSEQGLAVTMMLGASIGANLTIQYMAGHPTVRSGVALSPGLNYRGITARPLARQLDNDQRLFVAGARGDVRSDGSTAAEMAESIAADSAANTTQLFISDHDAHGTDLFETDPELVEEIVSWLIET